mmetsp:Transcript_23913/g.40374  ORF Transcript_23913/g.40374 Transcript_23913/m.40374 type:complete len:450 (-) Transcript_23913:32-1381(-)
MLMEISPAKRRHAYIGIITAVITLIAVQTDLRRAANTFNLWANIVADADSGGGRERERMQRVNHSAFQDNKAVMAAAAAARKSKNPRSGRISKGRSKRGILHDRSPRAKSARMHYQQDQDQKKTPSPGSAKNLSQVFVNSRWQLQKKIGSGAFGVIYKATCNQTGAHVAVKMEKLKAHSQLHFEQNIFKILSGHTGIPSVHWYGSAGNYNAMVATLLGPSLQRVFEASGNRFSLKTSLLLAVQMVSRLQHVHEHHFIHGDVKPDNFVMGLQNSSRLVHLIDFGLAKKFRHPITRRHVPWSQRDGLEGTARYASVNAHKGIQQSRRDDLESLAYVLTFFYRGILPWQGLKAKTKKEKYEQILAKKMSLSPSEITAGCPEPFEKFLIYARNLGFDQDPDYDRIRSWFTELFEKEGYKLDYVYDWNLPGRHAAAPATSTPLHPAAGAPAALG